MIVIDLAMINDIENLLREHIIFLAHTIIQHPLVEHIIFTLVLANAPLVIITHLLDAINPILNVLLRNHVLIATEVDLILIQKTTQKLKKTHCQPNLTQQPPSLIHHPPSTVPKFEIRMNQPNTSPCTEHSTLSKFMLLL